MAESKRTARQNNHTQLSADAAPEHEQSDVSVKGIAVFLAILAGVAVILHFGLAGTDLILKKLTRNQDQQSGLVADPALARARPNFPEPRLQVTPREDLETFRAREEAELNSYGWIDKTAGIVRLPIERAMDLLVERGVPIGGTNDTPSHISNLQLQRSQPEQQ